MEIFDQMVITIYSKEELKSDISNDTKITNDAAIKNDDKKIENKENNNKININTSSKSELMSLTKIGEVKAKAIIEYRSINGNFKTIEDIKKVKGIGDTLFETIKNNITV